jgi:hypothetical protein
MAPSKHAQRGDEAERLVYHDVVWTRRVARQRALALPSGGRRMGPLFTRGMCHCSSPAGSSGISVGRATNLFASVGF